MKKAIFFGTLMIAGSLMILSCKKNKCAECHYDKDGNEVELGKKCGDELKKLEKNGYSDGSNQYPVHCGEGHH